MGMRVMEELRRRTMGGRGREPGTDPPSLSSSSDLSVDLPSCASFLFVFAHADIYLHFLSLCFRYLSGSPRTRYRESLSPALLHKHRIEKPRSSSEPPSRSLPHLLLSHLVPQCNPLKYTPSLPLAVVATVLYALCSLGLSYGLWKHGQKWMLTLSESRR